jgi:hypothetical protein
MAKRQPDNSRQARRGNKRHDREAGWQMQPRREYQGGRKAKRGRHGKQV